MNAFGFKIVASEIIRRTNLVLFTVKINHRTNSQISPMPIRPFSMQRLIIWGIFGSWNSMSLQQKSLIKTRILREKSSSQLVSMYYFNDQHSTMWYNAIISILKINSRELKLYVLCTIIDFEVHR